MDVSAKTKENRKQSKRFLHVHVDHMTMEYEMNDPTDVKLNETPPNEVTV